MNRALVAALVVVASTAHADGEQTDGLMAQVNVLGANSFGTVVGLLPGASAGSATSVLAPSAAVGFGFGGSNAILVNIGLLGFGPGTNIAFTVSPLFRHYWTPLHSGAVSVFLEGGLAIGFLSPASGASNYLLGVLGGIGAEWMFVQHLGLIVDGLVQYGHVHYSAGGFTGDFNLDLIGLAGNVGLIIHW